MPKKPPKTMTDLLERGTQLPSGCIVWTGTTTLAGRKGYGRVWDQGRHYVVHRLAYALAVGPVPTGMELMHSCDVQLCFNPEHLRPGTPQENTDDKVSKRRHRHGSTHTRAKLNEAGVVVIRERLTTGEHPNDIAKDYGVAPSIIYNIKARRIWRHVE